MRYLIEPKNRKAEEELVKNEHLKVITSYDPIQKLTADVEKIGVALREFKKTGVSWDIFNYYLRGRGIPQQTIDSVMGEVKEFFRKIGIF